MKDNIKCYLKIFLIPTFLFIIIMYIGSDNIKDFFDIFIEMFIIIFIWFLISLPITLIFLKLRNLKIIEFFFRNFVYLCTILNFLIFIYFRSIFIIENIFKSVIITILLFIPTVFSLILIYFNRKQILKLKKINLLQILSIFSSIVYIFIILISSIFIMACDGVNNRINYWRVRNLYFNKKFEFPKKIPKTAKDIMFHYNPQFLQGGEIFSLYFKSDKNIIEYYNNKYKKLKLNENNIKMQEIEKINKSFLYFTPYNNKEDKMQDFTIYILYNECDDSGYCNHGTTKFIAINDKVNEIIFYYENW